MKFGEYLGISAKDFLKFCQKLENAKYKPWFEYSETVKNILTRDGNAKY